MNAADLKRVDVLAEFSDEDREALAELLELQDRPAGRRIFSEGGEADDWIIVLEGRVRIESRRKPTPAHLEAGASLGALALFAVGPREATVFCETDCRLARLERHAYRRLADDHPRTACRLVEAIVQTFSTHVRENLDGDPA